MSDWVQKSFEPLAGAQLPSGPMEASWMKKTGVIKFSKASTEWLLDLQHRILTGQEELTKIKREAALSALREELGKRALNGQCYSLLQVQMAVQSILRDIIEELWDMSQKASENAQTNEKLYGGDKSYFVYLDEERFLYGLRDYIERKSWEEFTAKRLEELIR